jgi:hypothetical protein
MSPITPIPSVTIPGVPTGVRCCLWQVHKKANGVRKFDVGAPYSCPTGQTTRGDTAFTLALTSAGRRCDQDPALIPDGSQLSATGNTILRVDGLAHFFGKFTITNPRGRGLFSGVMEVIDRVGTHPGETCNPTSHFEGWLVGRSGRGLSTATLRAVIAGTSRLPEGLPTGTFSADVAAILNGVVIKCPQDE